MITLIRTNSDHADFITLVKKLDLYLAGKDGDDHAFYAGYNKLDNIKHVVVSYHNNIAAGCGAIKAYAPEIMEIKRMYTEPIFRGRGIATQILAELETWAVELGHSRCILETGKRQEEAVKLYPSRGYKIIPNYGQYAGKENSICFEKIL